MSKQKTVSETPHTDAFRAWLAEAITALGLTPSTVSRAVNAGVNSVGAFLRDPNRDITLGRAAELERHLRAKAREAGVDLPPIRKIMSGVS